MITLVLTILVKNGYVQQTSVLVISAASHLTRAYGLTIWLKNNPFVYNTIRVKHEIIEFQNWNFRKKSYIIEIFEKKN